MPRFTADQLAFAATKRIYMGRDESIEFMQTMNIKLHPPTTDRSDDARSSVGS